MPWMRHDTITYLADQEHLVSLLLEYKHKAINFCKERGIENPDIIVAAIIMTSAWIYDRLDYPLTVGLAADILNIPYEDQDNALRPNTPITITRALANLTHEKLLETITEAIT